MLDTNICSYIIRNQREAIKKKLKEVENEHRVALSTIVVSELLYGAYKKGSKKLIEVIKNFIEYFTIYEYDLKAAEEYKHLKIENWLQSH